MVPSGRSITFERQTVWEGSGRCVGCWVSLGRVAFLLRGCSGTPTASNRVVTPPLPPGWKTVIYHGVGIDVPRSWAVEPWHPNCGIHGVSSPTVFIGPEGISTLFCPEFLTGGAQVILGSRNLPGSALVNGAAEGTPASRSAVAVLGEEPMKLVDEGLPGRVAAWTVQHVLGLELRQYRPRLASDPKSALVARPRR